MTRTTARLLPAILILMAAQAGPALSRDLALSAERIDDRIIVRVDGVTFTCYRFGPGQKYPYLHPVNGPRSGVSVTTESSLPYPHHRSLFFGCDRVNGGNYWQEGNDRGQIVSRGAEAAVAGPDTVRITDVCDWRIPGENPVITDRRTIVITAPSPDIRLIDVVIELTPVVDVHIGKTNHSLFSARMAPALSVKEGGVLVNAGGGRSEAGTAGERSPWCDYHGFRFGVREGLAILESPANRWYPNRWFTRDYGFFSPTSLYWMEESGLDLPAGVTERFAYRVVVHGGDTDEAGIPALFEEWERMEGR